MLPCEERSVKKREGGGGGVGEGGLVYRRKGLVISVFLYEVGWHPR